jgi:hypothetical protein
MYPAGIVELAPSFCRFDPPGKQPVLQRVLVILIGFLALCSASISWAQPYGLDYPQAVGPYLNNVFPTTAPSASASWNVDIAFTNTSIDQPMFMLPYPGTNRLVILRKPGVIATFPNRPDVAQAPVPDGYLEETTQPVPGQPLEMVTARIVDVTRGGFFRLQISTVQP